MLNKKRKNIKQVNKSDTFLSKLYDILNTIEYHNIIKWDKEGIRIIITDVNKLTGIIMPKFYKHRNYPSFVRQLNLYGFKKVKNTSKKGIEYENKEFNRNITEEQINKISRKDKNKMILTNIEKKDNIIDYIKKYEESINNQNELIKEMNEIKKENNELKKQIKLCNSRLDKLNINSNKIKTMMIILMSFLMNTNKKNNNNKINFKGFIKKYLDFKKKYANKEKKVNIKKNYPIDKVESFFIEDRNKNDLSSINNRGLTEDYSIFNYRNESINNSLEFDFISKSN